MSPRTNGAPSGSSRALPIRFGIPSLDILLGRPNPQVYHVDSVEEEAHARLFGVYEKSADGAPRDSLCLCILGTDGTGKSVLAMHLAAQYLSDRQETPCRVVYASTDLSYTRASTTWDNFALGFPRTRIPDPFDFNEFDRRMDERGKRTTAPTPELSLVNMPPFATTPEDVDKFKVFAGESDTSNVFFLDIAGRTSGDDWSYLNRLVSSLRPSEKGQPLHLLVVDTVDDLELLVGDRDAFGNPRDRRSRIAELIRTAAGKCHILLVASDIEPDRTPEEYIADVVIRVKFQRQGEYQRRVLSVEKVRGQNHIRGEHDMTIRSGIGASTGRQEHFDDPRIIRPGLTLTTTDQAGGEERSEKLDDPRKSDARIAGDLEGFDPSVHPEADHYQFQSYVHVAHSLHYINNSIMRADGPSVQGDSRQLKHVDFGIQYLDELLAEPTDTEDTGPSHATARHDSNALPAYEPAALIGEDGTFKSALSKAFLSRALRPSPRDQPSKDPQGVTILLTTKTLDRDSLRQRLSEHLTGNPKDAPPEIYNGRIICRRLEFHHMTSATLFHIIKQSVRAAQRILFNDPVAMGALRRCLKNPESVGLSEADKRIDQAFHERLRKGLPRMIPRSEAIRRLIGWRIRIVIDNWTTLEEMYPEVQKDPLFLLCVLFFLRREGIATLIVANEDRGFSEGFNVIQNRRLRDQTSVHILTWRTPFFGESRVAITVNPPVGRQGRFDTIRELRRLPSTKHINPADDRVLGVSPFFELFVGLEKREPEYVPLRVWLIDNTGSDNTYLDDIQHLFGWLLKADANAKFITSEPIVTYERLRDFSQLQGSSRFPYTLVIQIDEFWAKTGALHFQRMNGYLTVWTARTTQAQNGRNDETAEPGDAEGAGKPPSQGAKSPAEPSLVAAQRGGPEQKKDEIAASKRPARPQEHGGAGTPAADIHPPPRSPDDKKASKYDVQSNIVEDPHNLFQPTATDLERSEARDWKRTDFFTPPGYYLKTHVKENADKIIKVPYTWDFGFLMCHREAWAEFEYFGNQSSNPSTKEAAEVWNRLHRFTNKSPGDNEWPSTLHDKGRPSWREFVEVCTQVALFANRNMTDGRGRTFTTFGVAPEVQETLSCLLLEIWATELDQLDPKIITFKKDRHDPETKEDLRDLLGEAAPRRALLRALCLLHDLIPPSLISADHRLVAGEAPEGIPVAFRAWYSSADAIQNRSSGKDWYVPAGLPGRFSARGDWFLGIARGSRSVRLGERVIDLLSTRRSNIIRLQHGIGLPVRDNRNSGGELWTTLRHIDEWGNPVRRVSYAELVRLGGPMASEKGEKSPLAGGPLQWLWRSRIGHYDRHARILRRWTCAALRKLRDRFQGAAGVVIYKDLLRVGDTDLSKWFDREVEEFRDTLARATIETRTAE